MIPRWLSRYVDKDGQKRIENAIFQAERLTSGEIVPMIVRRSSTVGHVPIILFLIFVLSYYVIGFDELIEARVAEPWQWIVGWTIISLVLSFLLGRVGRVQRLFVSSPDRESQALARAMNEFYHLNMDATKQATGVLLFISLDDHKAVVLADKSISDSLPTETWNEVIGTLLKGAKAKDIAGGFCQAIEMTSAILKEHFPIRPDDTNELANHLVIKD